MGVSTGVYAIESGVKAPEIGDAGFVGAPPIDSKTGDHLFNRVYAGLETAGLVTQQLEAFKAFLDRYGRERLYWSVEGGDESEESRIVDELLEAGKITKFEVPERTYTTRKYRISAGDDDYLSQHPDPFPRTATFTATKEALAPLIEDVFGLDDWESHFYRLWGVLDPYDGDLGHIRAFVLDHPGPFRIEFPSESES